MSATWLKRFLLVSAILLIVVPELGMAQPAAAAPSSGLSGGVLTITLSGSDSLLLTCQGGIVKVNGSDLDSGPAPCASVRSILVNGGSGANTIDLSAVTAADFTHLVHVSVDGGAGNDRIAGSQLADTLLGGAGDDLLVGVQPDDQVDGGTGKTFFAESPLPTNPRFSRVLSSSGDPADSPEPLAPALGTSFGGIDFVSDAAVTSYYFIPPDPIGAAGPNHVVSVVNTAIDWYDKSGTSQNRQRLGRNSSNAVGSFFESLTPLTPLFDPKVIYDQYAGRFVVVALEEVDSPADSRILLAVSDDSDPNGTWYYQAIDAQTMISGNNSWADYPGLAVDKQVVYVTANMFTFAGGSSAGVRLWIIDKTGLYSGGTSTVTVNDPYASAGFATTTQPAHMFGTPPPNVGTFLVSYGGLSDGTNEYMQVIRLNDPLGTPTFTNQVVSLGNVDNTSVASLPGAPQNVITTTYTVETNDRRALQAVWRDSALWATFELIPNLGQPSAGEVTAHWVKVNTANLGSLALADQGNVGGEDIATGTFTFFPSIAVDPCGNMAMGFAASAPTIYPGAYYTGRLASDPAGTVQSSGTLAAGVDYYYRVFGRTRNRWGDYSGIFLDPGDDATFWIFNEYAITRGTILPSYPDQDGRWGTQFGSFQLHTTGLDFGDLPASYNVTTRAKDGARHCLGTLYLGSSVSADSDGQPSITASADTYDDGVTRAAGPGTAGQWQNGTNGGAVDVQIGGSGSGCLNGWIDWDNDGNFTGANEQVINNASVSAGTTPHFQFDIPNSTFTTNPPNVAFNARFRLFASCPIDPANAFTGTASNGEVEDYQWSFMPTALTMQNFAASQAETRMPWAAAFALLLGGVGTATLWIVRRRRADLG